jgi:hypothetical protein
VDRLNPVPDAQRGHQRDERDQWPADAAQTAETDGHNG